MNDIKGVVKSTMVSLGIVMLTPWFHHNFLRIETGKWYKENNNIYFDIVLSRIKTLNQAMVTYKS